MDDGRRSVLSSDSFGSRAARATLFVFHSEAVKVIPEMWTCGLHRRPHPYV